MNIIESFKKWYRGLPDKKRYLEFLTALLTIPVLLTVFLSNIRNLKGTTPPPPTETPKTVQEITYIPVPVTPSSQNGLTPTPAPTPTAAPSKECTRQVGPVEIVYPDEGEVVSGNPICIDISYNQGSYCSVVWSYRLNGSAWSEYTDRSICLYDVPRGAKTLELRVKSVASNDEAVLKRSFTVSGATPTPTATSSATPQ